MVLPVDIDATHDDTGGATRKLHQQHHDEIHVKVNNVPANTVGALAAKADLIAGTVPDGQLPVGLARDAEVAAAVATETAARTAAIAAQALADSATYAQVQGGALSVNGTPVDDTAFPASLARDSEVAASVANAVLRIHAGSYISVQALSRGTLALGVGLQAGVWLDVSDTVRADRIGFEVTTAGAAGALVTVGLYRLDAANVLTRVILTAAIAADTIGVKEATVNVVLSPGRYAAFTLIEVAGSTLRSTTAVARSAPLADTTDALSDPRGGIHPNVLANPPQTSLAATFTMVATGAPRSHAVIVYLRTAAV